MTGVQTCALPILEEVGEKQYEKSVHKTDFSAHFEIGLSTVQS